VACCDRTGLTGGCRCAPGPRAIASIMPCATSPSVRGPGDCVRSRRHALGETTNSSNGASTIPRRLANPTLAAAEIRAEHPLDIEARDRPRTGYRQPVFPPRSDLFGHRLNRAHGGRRGGTPPSTSSHPGRAPGEPGPGGRDHGGARNPVTSLLCDEGEGDEQQGRSTRRIAGTDSATSTSCREGVDILPPAGARTSSTSRPRVDDRQLPRKVRHVRGRVRA